MCSWAADTQDVREQIPRNQVWWVIGLGLVSLLGCQLWPEKPACHDDPLLLAKKPVTGADPPAAPPLLLAQAEPLVPLLPPTALASKPEPAESTQANEKPPPAPAPPEENSPPVTPPPAKARPAAVPTSRSKPVEPPADRRD
jgi:hypothetical protein